MQRRLKRLGVGEDWNFSGSHGSNFPRLRGDVCLRPAAAAAVNLHNHVQPFLVLPSLSVGLILVGPN